MKKLKKALGLKPPTLRELQDKYIPKYINQPKPAGMPKVAIGLMRSLERVI